MRQPVVVGRELEEAHGSAELRLGMRVQLRPVYPGIISFYKFKKMSITHMPRGGLMKDGFHFLCCSSEGWRHVFPQEVRILGGGDKLLLLNFFF